MNADSPEVETSEAQDLGPPAGEDLPVPEVVPVRREMWRGRIATLLVGIVGGVALVSLLLVFWAGGSADTVAALASNFFTALIGLLGAVIGFYFGTTGKLR